jgi:hypothetical protein
MNELKQLLCTFTDSQKYQSVIQEVQQTYTLIDNRIFVFANEKNLREIYLTFNIIKDFNNKLKYPGTISVHRKKQTNTLYTLNAMNKLIADENNGVFDKNFQLNWDLYKDSIILTNEIGVKVVSLKLFNIFSI